MAGTLVLPAFIWLPLLIIGAFLLGRMIQDDKQHPGKWFDHYEEDDKPKHYEHLFDDFYGTEGDGKHEH